MHSAIPWQKWIQKDPERKCPWILERLAQEGKVLFPIAVDPKSQLNALHSYQIDDESFKRMRNCWYQKEYTSNNNKVTCRFKLTQDAKKELVKIAESYGMHQNQVLEELIFGAEVLEKKRKDDFEKLKKDWIAKHEKKLENTVKRSEYSQMLRQKTSAIFTNNKLITFAEELIEQIAIYESQVECLGRGEMADATQMEEEIKSTKTKQLEKILRSANHFKDKDIQI